MVQEERRQEATSPYYEHGRRLEEFLQKDVRQAADFFLSATIPFEQSTITALIRSLCSAKELDLAREVYDKGLGLSSEPEASIYLDLIKLSANLRNEEMLKFFLYQFRDDWKIPIDEISRHFHWDIEKTDESYVLDTAKTCFSVPQIQTQKSAEISQIPREKLPGTLIEEQKQLEIGAREKHARLLQDTLSKVVKLGRAAELKLSTKLMVQWHEPLTKQIHHFLLNNLDKEYCVYMSQLAAQKLSVITIHSILGQTLSNKSGVASSRLFRLIGDSIENELIYSRIQKELNNTLKKLHKNSKETSKIRSIGRRLDSPDIPNETKLTMGASLTKLLIDIAKIDISEAHPDFPEKNQSVTQEVLRPAFEHKIVPFGKKKLGKIICHPRLSELLENDRSLQKIFLQDVRHHPMIVQPKDWVDPKHGGYVSSNVKFIRYECYQTQVLPILEVQDQLDFVYEALNVLGRTGWFVNEKVYQIVQLAWANGHAIGELPSRRDIPLPEKPPEPTDQSFWYKTYVKTLNTNNELHSLRCDFLLKMDVAEQFLGLPIYFPHNMDFRGRVYPLPPHLNHMGSDLCRGLLMFEKSSPLGPRGLYWLKIHLANLYGVDKVPFHQRIAFVDENLDEIIDSADRPLDGRQWWLNASSPWQCLASCFELVAAIRSPDPTKYVSHLPIHQDGSCNGLQHYAALGGDEEGAVSVNLIPSDAPRDVYSDVCTRVLNSVKIDIDNGLEIAQLVYDKIDRKVIKQTVMTSVYGVTFIGGRRQIYGQLKDKQRLPDERLYEASVYVTKKVFESLHELFVGAKSLKQWLSDCAKIIAKRENRPVHWKTPLGLPVYQPYRKPKPNQRVSTVLQTVTLKQTLSELPIDTNKQRSAFPPNYIHSLDSTHMMLTALACEKADITFASVHDSYWTHASSVDVMNQILREKFVELHQKPLLQELRDYWVQVYPKARDYLPEIPKLGSFDLNVVKQSKYFFH